MKRAAILIAILIVYVTIAQATTCYVDLACPTPGNGSGGYTETCDGTAAGNPATDISTCISAVSTGGDIVNIRGVHSAHGSCPGSTTGRYQTNKITVAKTGLSGNPLIIQGYGWTAAGTAEKVYIDGTATVTWTQCSGTDGNCNCGPTTQAQVIGSGGGGTSKCTGTYWVTGTGNYSKAIGAQNSDGTPTPRYSATTSLTNAHGTYLTGRCTDETWRPCSATADCTAGTCSAAATAEHDSYSAQSASADLLVRWDGAPAATTAVYNDSDGVGFDVVGSSFVTIRGLIFRAFRRQGIFTSSNNTVITDVKLLFDFDLAGGGSGYGTFFSQATPISISNSEIAYNSDEGIHTTAASGATALTISDNWIHDQGNLGVIGTGTGTPSGMICSQVNEPSHTTGPGNYTGSTFSGNLIEDQAQGGSSGRGLILESHCDNWTIRDNIFKSTNASCLKFNPADGATNNTDNTQVFNNLFISCGDACIEFSVGASQGASSNSIYNNTCVNPAGSGIDTSTIGGTFASNLIRDNIFYTSGSGKMVNWTNTTSTNVFEYNLVTTTGATAVTWLNTNRACSAISAAGTGNINNCPNPLFTNSTNNDYHIQSASPAKDAGTSTGMPSGRTKDINNTVADDHGLPSYADNQAISSTVDIGADEVSTGGTVTLTISKTDSPDPVFAGNNITYTLAYQNTGTTSATGVVITDPIPSNTTFVSATGGGTSDGTTVTWSIGTVTAGASSSVQMVVTVASPLADGTVISNTAYAITSNETASVVGVADTTTVTSLPVLLLSMSDAPDPVLAGSNITYTIFYSNTGTAGATNVVITDAVPVNTTFVSATNGGTNSGGTVTWTIGAVNAGSFGSVQMVVTASSGLSNGASVTNSTYTLASSELSTISGTPISTGVIALITNIPQPKFPITSRQNGWTQTQTLLFDGADDVIQTPNSGQWIRGQVSENLTLSTSGSTTDTSANLLPANSIIEAVVARVTTTITVATDWKLGDAAQTARFTSADSTMTAGETKVGLNHMNPTVATADLGPVQTSAAKVRVTTTGTPGAGAIRITVFYRQFVPPTN